jgi:hypothetical protein
MGTPYREIRWGSNELTPVNLDPWWEDQDKEYWEQEEEEYRKRVSQYEDEDRFPQDCYKPVERVYFDYKKETWKCRCRPFAVNGRCRHLQSFRLHEDVKVDSKYL